MTRLLLPLAFLLAVPTFAQPGWEALNLDTTEDLLALSPRLRSQERVVVGTNGFVARTSLDTGSWRTTDAGTAEDLLSVIEWSIGGFWVSGRNGVMRYSADYGATWQTKDLPDTGQDYVLDKPSSNVFAFGDAGGVYLSASPGGTWSPRESGTTSALYSMDAYDASLPSTLVVGEDGTLLRAAWDGTTWTPMDSGTTADLHAIVRVGATAWLIVGEDGLILKSTDDGETWTPKESGTAATLHALAESRNGERHLAVGEDGTVLETYDLGETWCRHDTGTDANIYTAAPTNTGSWIIAGEAGLFLRSTAEGSGGCVTVSIEEVAPEAGYAFSAAWPNPAIHRAALSLSVDRPQHVTAEVLDLLGRRVAVLFHGPMARGTTQALMLERRGLPSGTYVVRVTGEAFAASRRITLV